MFVVPFRAVKLKRSHVKATIVLQVKHLLCFHYFSHKSEKITATSRMILVFSLGRLQVSLAEGHGPQIATRRPPVDPPKQRWGACVGPQAARRRRSPQIEWLGCSVPAQAGIGC